MLDFVGVNQLTIPEGKVIPDNSVVMGSPGKVVKILDASGEAMLRNSALHYANHFKKFIELEEVRL